MYIPVVVHLLQVVPPFPSQKEGLKSFLETGIIYHRTIQLLSKIENLTSLPSKGQKYSLGENSSSVKGEKHLLEENPPAVRLDSHLQAGSHSLHLQSPFLSICPGFKCLICFCLRTFSYLLSMILPILSPSSSIITPGTDGEYSSM